MSSATSSGGRRATPTRDVTVANELHIPVGEPVALRLTSADVIHSFWVPDAARQARPAARTVPTRSSSRPTSRRRTAASAPSSAGCSTPTWGCSSWPSRASEFDRLGRRAAGRRPPRRPDRGGRARPGGLPRRRLRDVPHDRAARRRRRRTGAGPDPPGQPADAGGRHASPTPPEDLAAWVRDPQAIKAGVAHAAPELTDERARRPGRLPGGPRVTDDVHARSARRRRRRAGTTAERNAPLWADPPGLWGQLTGRPERQASARACCSPGSSSCCSAAASTRW